MAANTAVPDVPERLLLQGSRRIVEFHFACLDAKGAVISSSVDTLPPECTPEAARDEPAPERACSATPSNSVDAPDGHVKE